MKKWLFSIVMWFIAVFIVVFLIIAIIFFEEQLLFKILIILSCFTPAIFMSLGLIGIPDKDE